jgi:hypothetical protein
MCRAVVLHIFSIKVRWYTLMKKFVILLCILLTLMLSSCDYLESKGLLLEKNPEYWDAENVHLEKVTFENYNSKLNFKILNDINFL